MARSRPVRRANGSAAEGASLRLDFPEDGRGDVIVPAGRLYFAGELDGRALRAADEVFAARSNARERSHQRRERRRRRRRCGTRTSSGEPPPPKTRPRRDGGDAGGAGGRGGRSDFEAQADPKPERAGPGVGGASAAAAGGPGRRRPPPFFNRLRQQQQSVEDSASSFRRRSRRRSRRRRRPLPLRGRR